MGFSEGKRALKPLPCHRGLLRWVKISVEGQGDTMGQQSRELLLPLCFAWLAGGKKKGKDTMNPMPAVAVRSKGGYLGSSMEGLHEPSKQ